MPSIFTDPKLIAAAKTVLLSCLLAGLGAAVAALTTPVAGVDPLYGALIGFLTAFIARLSQVLVASGVELSRDDKDYLKFVRETYGEAEAKSFEAMLHSDTLVTTGDPSPFPFPSGEPIFRDIRADAENGDRLP